MSHQGRKRIHLDVLHFDGLMQNCKNSIANSPELLQSWTKSPICLYLGILQHNHTVSSTHQYNILQFCLIIKISCVLWKIGGRDISWPSERLSHILSRLCINLLLTSKYMTAQPAFWLTATWCVNIFGTVWIFTCAIFCLISWVSIKSTLMFGKPWPMQYKHF